MEEFKVVKKETLSDRKYRLELFEVSKPGGTGTEPQLREIYFRPDAAAILLYDPDRNVILLTRQFRLPVHLKFKKQELYTEACAGVIDEGELPEHAIVREVEEETGYRISEIRLIAEGFTSPSSFMEYIYLFTGKFSPDMKVSKGGGKKEEGEDIELLELTAQEAREKLKSREIRDIKTIVLLQHAIIEGII